MFEEINAPDPVPEVAVPQFADTLSLTETGSNPDLSELNRPWEEAQAKYRSDMSAWKNKATRTVYNTALDWDASTKDKAVDLSFDPDPQRAKDKILTQSFLQVQNDGKPIPGGELGYKLYLDKVDQELFGGTSGGDEVKFAGQVKKQATYQKGQDEIYSQIERRAAESALTQSVNLLGMDLNSYRKFQGEQESFPNWDPAKSADYLELWNSQRDHTRSIIAPYREELTQVVNAIGDDNVGTIAQDIYARLTPEQRPGFIEAVGTVILAQPDDKKPTLLANMGKSIGRPIQGILDSTQKGLTIAGNVDYSMPSGSSVGAGRYSQPQTSTTEALAPLNFSQDLQDWQERYSPVRPLASNAFLKTVESGIYKAPGVVEGIVPALIPAVGPAYLLASATGGSYGHFRSEFIAKGMDPQTASEQAQRLAPVAGAASTVAMLFGAKMLKGIPYVDNVLKNIADKAGESIIARGTARFVTGAAIDTANFRALEFIDPIVQAAAKDFGAPIPGVELHNEHKTGVLDNFGELTLETAASVIPLALAASFRGMGQDNRARIFASSTDLQMKAFGYSEAQIKTFRDSQAKGTSALSSTIDEIGPKFTPKSTEAIEARRQLEAQTAAAAEVQKSGLLPKFVTTAEGTTVIDPDTGKPLGPAGTFEEAQRIAAAHSSALDGMKADQVQFLTSMLEGQQQAARTKGEENSSIEFTPGEKRIATEKESTEYVDSQKVVDQRAAEEIAAGGTGEITYAVAGSSKTEFDQDVRQTVNKIYNGASILDVIHEVTHGKLEDAWKKGTLTFDETVQALRAYDSALPEGVAKTGERIRFLPEGEVTPDQVKEGVSRFMESEGLRTRKDANAPGKIVEGPVITANLSAAARQLAPEAGRKFFAWVKAMRDYFGVTFTRAREIGKALKEGKLDAAAHEKFVSKIMGLEGQDAHNAKAIEVSKEIAGTAAAKPEVKFFERTASDGQKYWSTDDVAAEPRHMDHRFIYEEANGKFTLGTSAKEYETLNEAQDVVRQQLTESLSLRPTELIDKLGIDVSKLAKDPVEKSRYIERTLDALGKLKRWAADGVLYGAESFSGDAQARALREIEGRRETATETHDTRLAEIDAKAETSKQAERAKLLEKFGPEDGKSREEKKAFNEAVRQAEAKVEKQRKLDVAKSEKVRDRELTKLDASEKDLATKGALSDQRQATLNALASFDGLLSALPSEIRAQVGGYTKLASLTTDAAREKYFTDRVEKIGGVLEKYARKEYGSLMGKLMKRASLSREVAGKTPKGKATPETHALFSVFKDAMRWNPATVEKEATARENEVAAGIAAGTMDAATQIRLETEANGIRLVGDWNRKFDEVTRTKLSDGADASRRAAAFRTLENLWNEGYAKARLQALQRAEDLQIDRGKLQTDTGKSGSLPEKQAQIEKDSGLFGKWKESLLSLSSFEQVMNYAFGKKSEISNRLIEAERKASDAKEDSLQLKFNRLEDFFTQQAGGGYKGDTLRHDMATKQDIKVTASQGDLKFTQNEGVKITMLWRQADGKRHMEGSPSSSWKYDQAFVDAVESQLTPEAKAFRAFLSAEYGAEHSRLNAVFRKLNGVDLPQIDLYSPVTVTPQQAAVGQVVNPVTGMAGSANSSSPGSLKTRGIGIAEPNFSDALQTYIAHTKEIEHYIAYAEASKDAAGILNNRDVMNSVQAKGGKEAASVIRQWVDLFAQGGSRDAAAQLAFNGRLSKMVNRASSVALVGRASVLAIQSLQLGAGLAEMPSGAYAVRLAKLFTGQLGWGEAIKSEYIQRRLGELPPLVRQAMEGLRAETPSRLKYATRQIGKLIGGADALFTAGTYAMVYDYQLKQAPANLSKAEAQVWAHTAAERATDRVAQPTKAAQRSLYENTNTSPLAKLSWAFASEARQKLAMTAWDLASKDVPAGQKLRSLAVTWGVGGMGAAILRAALRDARDSQDDEVFDERNWSPKRLLLSSLTGPLQGVPVLGSGLESAIFKAAGEYQPEGNLLSNGVEALGSGKRLVTGTEKDTEHTIKDVEAILSGFGIFNEQAAAAGSLSHLARDLFQIGKNATK